MQTGYWCACTKRVRCARKRRRFMLKPVYCAVAVSITQEYLSAISEVAAIQPMLAEFLGVTVAEFTGKSRTEIGTLT
jgi:hypothetical protein